MKIIDVQFTPWGKRYWFDPQEHELKVGDCVIVKTEIGIELGRVKAIKEIEQDKIDKPVKPITRKATLSDIEKIEKKNKYKEKDIEICKKLVEKNELPIKIVGVHYSFDGGRLTFYFIAKGRVDFRELVKDLTHKFQKSICLRQIGVRDEAKASGDIGPCGMTLCCKDFLNRLGEVNSDFAETQQVLHRGSSRLSGMCGRLKCCLKFEQEHYAELRKNMPALGSIIKTAEGKGKVVAQHVLKQTVDVQLEKDESVILEVEV